MLVEGRGSCPRGQVLPCEARRSSDHDSTLSAEDEHNGNDEIENERRALAAQLESHELPQISGPHVAMQVKR